MRSADAVPEVELLWWRGCPSADDAIEIVREEMRARGLDPEALDVREIETDEAAERERFVGSPTIRIGGRDIEPPGDEPVGLSCRVYRRPDGGVSPLPDRERLRAALRQAVEAR